MKTRYRKSLRSPYAEMRIFLTKKSRVCCNLVHAPVRKNEKTVKKERMKKNPELPHVRKKCHNH